MAQIEIDQTLKDCFGNPMKIIPKKDRDNSDTNRILMLFKKDISYEEKQEIINKYQLSNQINENSGFVSFHTDYSIPMACFELNSFMSNLFDYKVYADVTYHVSNGGATFGFF
jgi:hypothetical protein